MLALGIFATVTSCYAANIADKANQSTRNEWETKDDDTEKIAVEAATKHEEARGWRVESVEDQNRGFDLISRKPHPEDPETSIDHRFIEVKGRAGTGQVLLSTNEHKTAERLRKDYWLYAVFNCASSPQLHAIQDPARLGWQPIVKIEHYHVSADQIIGAATNDH